MLGEDVSPIQLALDETEANDACNHCLPNSVACNSIMPFLQRAAGSCCANHHTLVVNIHDGGAFYSKTSELVPEFHTHLCGNS